MCFFGTARLASAPGPCLTVVVLTSLVLAQGGGGVITTWHMVQG